MTECGVAKSCKHVLNVMFPFRGSARLKPITHLQKIPYLTSLNTSLYVKNYFSRRKSITTITQKCTIYAVMKTIAPPLLRYSERNQIPVGCLK